MLSAGMLRGVGLVVQNFTHGGSEVHLVLTAALGPEWGLSDFSAV